MFFRITNFSLAQQLQYVFMMLEIHRMDQRWVQKINIDTKIYI